ncbi:MAG: ArsA family ATPase [Proteobacteria bacterium]|nr:ArsA family ATPase [Pseudomonadota bacterium]
MRTVLYTGKGGVGKTTTAAATAVCAAERGLRTLVVSTDAAHSLGDVLEHEVGPKPRRIAPKLTAVEVDPRVEMAHHWGSIRDYLVQLFRYQGIEEIVAEELALLPGAEEITALLAVEEQAKSRRFDLIVVDCAPTDSTLRLVTLPDVAHGALRLLLFVQRALSGVVTPLARNLVPVPLPDAAVFADAERLLYRRLREIRNRITHSQTSVRFVVTPERMVIDEARRAWTDLSLFEVTADAVIMNRLLPEVAAEEEFFRDWYRVQAERVDEVQELFAPLRLLRAPLQDDEATGLERLARHGEALFGGESPAAVLSDPPRLRFTRGEGGYRALLPLPHAVAEELDVVKVDDDLVVSTGVRRRAVKLPRRLAALEVQAARLRDGELEVTFGRAGAGR